MSGTAYRNLLQRLAAAAYDLLLLGGVIIVTSLPIVIARGGEAVPAGNPLFRVFVALQVVAYFVGFWSRGGQTPGMRAWKLRVSTRDGTPLGTGAALRRFAAAALSLAPLGAGLLWMLVDRDGLAWHDRICATAVTTAANQRD